MSGYSEAEDWTRIEQPDIRKRVQNRLSQRRHRAKVSQRAAPVSQEILIPSSSTSPPISDGSRLENGQLGPSFSFIGPDERRPTPMLGQTQEAYDPFDGFGPQYLRPPHQTISNEMTPQVVPLSSAVSPPSSLPAETSEKFWSSQPSSDRTWTNAGLHLNSAETLNPTQNTTTPQPGSGRLSCQTSRPESRSAATRMSDSFSDQQHTVPITPFHVHGIRQSCVERCQASGHGNHNYNSRPESASVAPNSPSRVSNVHQSPFDRNRPVHQHPWSHSGFGTITTEAANTHSHDRGSHDQSLPCHSCGALGPFEDHSTEPVSPQSAISSLSQNSAQRSSSDNLRLLSECSMALANIARQSTQDGLASSLSQNCGLRKSGRNTISDCSPGSDRNSRENSCRETHCQKAVEKVVIVYLQK